MAKQGRTKEFWALMGIIARFMVILFFCEMLTLALFISKIGLLNVFLLCALSAMVGGYMVRHGGLAALLALSVRNPAKPAPVFEGVFVLLSGLLFIFPGFLSDLIALMLMLPAAQSWLGRHMTQKNASGTKNSSSYTHPTSQDGVIEGDFVVVEDPSPTLQGPEKP